MKDILLVDNFDSFTYNLVHYLDALEKSVDVRRNNDLSSIDIGNYRSVIISPGPGVPDEAGELMSFLKLCDGKVPVLGICLGMQAIAIHLGGGLKNKLSISHGVEDSITITQNKTLFKGVEKEIRVGLYHSWEVNEDGNYLVVAKSISDQTIMAIESIDKRFYGVQFHPESIMTEHGKKILSNFLEFG